MARAFHRASLVLDTPLGTPLAGDTLFGQLCWALRESKGSAELTRQLEGYTQGQPWAVVSDGFPAGFLPKPTLPQYFEPQVDPAARKAAKMKRWVPANRSGDTLAALLESAKSDTTAYDAAPLSTMQPHNTLNRLTGSTGEGAFAPYTMPLTFYGQRQRIDLYLVLDEDHISATEAENLLAAVGGSGFGRDASTGLGKFSAIKVEPTSLVSPVNANAFWTLAPCAPQVDGFDGARSFWRVQTRFGRHGNAHGLAGNPFKTPILMATTGAVFMPAANFASRLFVGQGLGADGRLSKAEPATVHQGYAPVLPIAMEVSPS
jgi:CRISPR-associated protein Csm4